MARKKKKQQRKQRINQRRANIARKRKMVSRNKPVSVAKDPEQEIAEDILPLFPLLADSGEPTPADMQQIMTVVLDSDDLADEPEFEEIIFDPMLSAHTFVEVGQELGWDPDAAETLNKLSKEEQNDKFFELMEQTSQRLFTEEANREILSRLNTLRLRLKRSAKRKKVAKVAALQSFLSGQQSDEIWPMIGLIQALIQRSVYAGFELTATTADFAATAGIDEFDSISTISEKLEQSGLGKKATSFIKRIPGMRRFLENQVDQIWDEGAEAVFSGELYLALYTEEEIDAGVEIMRTIFGGKFDEESDTEDEVETKLTEENAKTLVIRIDEFVTALFTQDRLEQLRARLREIAKNSEVPKKWRPFVLMLQDYMADENAAEYEKGFLIRALMGEIRIATEKLAEEAEEIE